MKYLLIILTILLFSKVNAFADIAPNPINAKGIVASQTSKIKMVSELVVVDLYKDSSVVECTFYMRNEGEKEHVEIGFPEMSFHHFRKTSATEKRFEAFMDGKPVNEMDMYLPDAHSNQKQKSGKMNNDAQPWYLWSAVFEKGETKKIKVCYNLPFGTIKNGPRYFTYLLSTGADWWGSIDTAELIVNVKDFSSDLILESNPNNDVVNNNQLKWVFTNLEPTTKDDIKIYYEPYAGYLDKVKSSRPEPTFVLNGKDIVTKGTIASIAQEDIAVINVLKEKERTKKYTSGDEGVIVVYMKDFVLEHLDTLVASKSAKKQKLNYSSSSDFLEKYYLKIGQNTFEDSKVFGVAANIEIDKVDFISLHKRLNGKICIEVFF